MAETFPEPGVYVTTDADAKGGPRSTAIYVSGLTRGNKIYFHPPLMGWGWVGIVWNGFVGKEGDRYQKLGPDEWPEWLPPLPG